MTSKAAENNSQGDFIFKTQELTIEQVRALFFDSDAIVTQPEPVYKFKAPGNEFYYTFNPVTMRPEYFMPVTGFLAKVMPLAYGIIEKMVDMGKHAFNQYKNERALYGTMMDIEFNKLMIAGNYDMEAVPAIVREHHASSGSITPVEEWIAEFNTDITAFAQWVHDYDVKPLAIGPMLVSRELGIGGKLDLVCMMNAELYTDKTPKEKRKRVRRIVDYKSGKSGFYESHILQCESYRLIWDENFPEYPVDGIANFAPKAWLKAPSYDFKDHTGNPNIMKLQHYIEIARLDGLKPKTDVKMFTGKLQLGQPITGENYKVVPVNELIVEQMLKRI